MGRNQHPTNPGVRFLYLYLTNKPGLNFLLADILSDKLHIAERREKVLLLLLTTKY